MVEITLIAACFTYLCAVKNNKVTEKEMLSNLGIDALNEMQRAAIEAAKAPQDVVLLSATGSGKTLAFLLPIVEAIDRNSNSTQALIIVPSRELAQQIESVFRSMRT